MGQFRRYPQPPEKKRNIGRVASVVMVLGRSFLAAWGRFLPGAGHRLLRPSELAHGLRPLLVMTQARIANPWNYSDLNGWPVGAAGQKTRIGWQALPGAAVLEALACR